MTSQFISIINNETKLITTTIPDDINTKVDNYVEHMYDPIYKQWNDTFINQIFKIQSPNMNSGIYGGIFFDEDVILPDDVNFIINTAYELLTSAGFNVNPNKGYIHIDIFNMDTPNPIDTNYEVSCDNRIGHNNYESCVFYTRKDQSVKGDLDVYLIPPFELCPCPCISDKGQYFVLGTKSNLVILRSGNLYYQMQPHTGNGKEHILSVHFVKNNHVD